MRESKAAGSVAKDDSRRLWKKLGGGALGTFEGVEVHGPGGFVELPAGDGGEEDDDGPECDEDGGGPFGGELRPQAKEGAAVVDTDPDGDGVAQEAREGESPHELFARHVDGTGDQDEGRERHGRGKQGRQGDGEDGVVLHPVGDAVEDGFGDVLFEEAEPARLADGVREEAAQGGADGGESDEEEDVGLGGGEGDEQDVGDAGDGQRDEGAIDGGDGEKADEADVAHEVHEAAVGLRVGVGVRVDGGGGLEGERGRGCLEVEEHAGDRT
jgi:hypothetical protein